MKNRGFTLVELMVAMATSLLLMVLLVGFVNGVSRVSQRASATASAFDEARIAFGTLSRRLGHATLNPYWNVSYDSSGNPVSYNRMSDLHLLCDSANLLVPANIHTLGGAVFFQAPTGFDPYPNNSPEGSELNALGYFVEFRDTNQDSPLAAVLPAKWRFQLREFRQPFSELKIFNPSGTSQRQWFTDALSVTNPPVTTLADNIPLLIIRARTHQAGGDVVFYSYDSRYWPDKTKQPLTCHQLPQAVDILMLAIDVQLAQRMDKGAAMPVILPDTLFTKPGQLDDDAAELESYVSRTYPQASFRLFRASVPIGAAKWSSSSTP